MFQSAHRLDIDPLACKSSFMSQYSQVSDPGQYSLSLEVCNFSVCDFDLL